MNLSDPLSAISPGLHGKVLSVLTKAVQPLSGREVARRAGVSQAGAARVLAQLVEDGLVDRTDHPPTALFALNREHLSAPALETLVRSTERLLDRIGEATAQWTRPAVGVTVFGSVARGEAGRHSDVDVLVVRDDATPADDRTWEAQLAGLERLVRRATGNPCNLVEYARSELESASPPFVAAVRTEGITASGQPLRRLVGARRRRE